MWNIYQPFGIALPLTGRETGLLEDAQCSRSSLVKQISCMRKKTYPLISQYYESAMFRGKKLPVSKGLIKRIWTADVSSPSHSDTVFQCLLFRRDFLQQSIEVFISQRYQTGVITHAHLQDSWGTFYTALPSFPNGFKVEVLAGGKWPPPTVNTTENGLLNSSGGACLLLCFLRDKNNPPSELQCEKEINHPVIFM